MKRLVPITLISAALVACTAEEKLSPLGADAADAGVAPPPPPPIDAGLVKRTVMTRNPFGGPAGNHLADGDFELSTAPYAGGQVGFRAFSSGGSQSVVVPTETGGLCRSGLRCAVMKPGVLFLLRGTSAKNTGNVASGWAKVPEGSSCSVVRPVLINCDSFVVWKQLAAKDKTPGEDGWCHYTASISEQETATCLYVDSTLKKDTTALVDAFVLGPDDGTVHPQAAEFWAPDAELVARLEDMRAHVIATTPFGKPPRRPPHSP